MNTADKDNVEFVPCHSVILFVAFAGCAAAPVATELTNERSVSQPDASDEDVTDDDEEDEEEEEEEEDDEEEGDDQEGNDEEPDSGGDANDLGRTGSKQTASSQTGKTADGGVPKDAAADAGPRDGGAGARALLDAGAAKDAGRRDAGPADTGAPPAPSCSPSSCVNNCLLLARCCDVNDQCACQELLTGQCILPSLPGP